MSTSSLDVDVLVQRSLRRANGDLLAVGENGRLDGCAVSDGLFGRDHAIRLLPIEESAQRRAHPRHPRRAAHEHELVHLGGAHLHTLQHLPHRREGALEELGSRLLKARAREGERRRRLVPGGELHLYGRADVAVVEDARAVALVVHLDLAPLGLLAQRAHRFRVGPHVAAAHSLADCADDEV
mmetsp:Transcript_31850/g.74164  ORF Transcript_31850/g.74164 Transcript_31850/m.74164 type:complete len:183 (+) Transcript_31850:118-666(+)